jgi:hypothetical protein
MVAPWLAEQGLGWMALVLPILGMVVLVVANIDNIVGTWQGRWGSSLASWAIWAALGWVGFAAQLQMGAFVGAMLLAPVAAVSTAVAIGALRARRFAPPPEEFSWQRRVDIVCAIGAGLALVALLFSTGRQALVLTIVTDAIAAIPTYMAAYRQPDSLPTAPFTAGAVSAVLTLAAAPSWGFDDAGYAVYLYVMCRGLVWLIRSRRAALENAPVDAAAATARLPALATTLSRPLETTQIWQLWAITAVIVVGATLVGSAVASGMLPMHITVPGKAVPASLPLAG